MIQAPNAQYIPAYQPVQPNYQQQGAYYNQAPANNYSMPGVIYNYPTASSYAPAQTYSNGKSQYNGVNIEIFNPQGQAGVPNNADSSNYVVPANYVPVQQPVMMPAYPMAPTSQAIVQAPGMQPAQQAQVQEIPAPQVQQQPAAQIQQPMQQVPQPEVAQQPAPAAAEPIINQPVTPDPTKTPESFAGKLKTDDLNAQQAAIEEIATAVKEDDTLAPSLLDTQIFDSLVDIIDKDTSSLQGPSPEVIELRQKKEEELTADELKTAKTPSPLEMAEINKQYSLYTISYMQERLNNELEKRNGQALELKDLPCIEKVIDTAKSNQNPELRISAIAALSHIARPEYKADLNTIFELAKSDEDARVQEAAQKAIDLLNGGSAEAQQAA